MHIIIKSPCVHKFCNTMYNTTDRNDLRSEVRVHECTLHFIDAQNIEVDGDIRLGSNTLPQCSRKRMGKLFIGSHVLALEVPDGVYLPPCSQWLDTNI